MTLHYPSFMCMSSDVCFAMAFVTFPFLSPNIIIIIRSTFKISNPNNNKNPTRSHSIESIHTNCSWSGRTVVAVVRAIFFYSFHFVYVFLVALRNEQNFFFRKNANITENILTLLKS